MERQIPNNWYPHNGYRPVLLEIFVKSQHHRETRYKAANWVHIGQTTGRGKKSAVRRQLIPINDMTTNCEGT